MQIRRVIPMYNDDMEKLISAGKLSNEEELECRLRVVDSWFLKKYGTKATEDAFSVVRTTIFRWRKILKEHYSCIDSLIPQSRRPKR